MQLIPPAPHLCPICAIEHRADDPHNAQSLYYQYRFYGLRGRWPTWADAIAHCPAGIRAAWENALREKEAWTEPDDGQPPIADPPLESLHQPIGDPNSREFGPEPITTTIVTKGSDEHDQQN